MELRLENGDYIPDSRGGVVRVSGDEALLQRVLFRLTARRGSYPLMPALGSRLYLLRNEKPSAYQSLACQYAAEALSGLDGLSVTGANVTRNGDRLMVTVELDWQGDLLQVECEV